MARQLELGLRTPIDHAEFLHAGTRHGTVIVWEQQSFRKQWGRVEPQDDLAQAMSRHVGQPDRYFTPNQFHRWRRVELLRSLRSCYIDLDGCRDWRGALEHLREQKLPEPSLIVESGRGLHFYWPLEPCPGAALPVWQAVQDKLLVALQTFGSDAAARDCTRVLRIVGSINSKAAAEVRGYIISPAKWTLHELADEVLGPRNTKKLAQVVGLEAARAKRAASVHQKTGTYRLWHTRFLDLVKIADYHAFLRPRGVAEGHRDNVLFLLGVALSWFAAADTLQEAVLRLAKTYTPSFSEREAVMYTRPLIARAIASSKGETVEYNGEQRDPRYAFRTATLRQRLAGLITPELEPKLISLGAPKTDDEKTAIRRLQMAAIEAKRDRVAEGRHALDRATFLAGHDQERSKPWEALGISRATYFRRKAKGEGDSAQTSETGSPILV